MWKAINFILILMFLTQQTRSEGKESHNDNIKTYGFGLSGNLYKRVKSDLMKKATSGEYLMKNYHDTIMEPMMAAIKLKMDEMDTRSRISQIISWLDLAILAALTVYTIILHVHYKKRIQRLNET